ncbi:MAG: MBL fold metallo-hydrolase [Clostridiales bacterium]|nr:MBL fold metallo-hydrolase [Clostridiales bacterium]
MKHKTKRPLHFIRLPLIACILLCICLGIAALNNLFHFNDSLYTSATQDGVAYIHYIDVGQGDSSLIALPDGSHILIDAGPKSAAPALTRYLTDVGVTQIDYFILTHPHEDHIGGAPSVFENFEIANVIMPDAITNTRIFTQTLDAIENENCQNYIAEPAQTYTIGDTAQMTILGPIQTEKNNLNNCSIMLRFVYGNTAFVFTGDAEAKAEKQMLDMFAGQTLSCDLYQVGHHGSNTSSTLELLETLKPSYAIISCGKNNDYGHPHSEIIKRLAEQDVRCYRTDEYGNIVFSSNGNTVSLVNKTGA